MVSTRSGTTLKASNRGSNKNAADAPAPSKKSQQAANIKKKRKAESEVPEEEMKENVGRPSTPPPAASKVSTTPPNDSELAHLPSYERTPGRVGPIKELKFDAKPDIKPFKGPPGKKVRKTAWEKEEEYKQFALENEDHVFHEYAYTPLTPDIDRTAELNIL
jgi:hypothetical protein